MADNDDLGFIPDAPKDDHSDLGFVSDEKKSLLESLKERYPEGIDQAIGDIPVVGPALRSAKESKEDFTSSTLRSLPFAGKIEAGTRAGVEKLKGSDEDLSALYDRYKQMVEQKKLEAETRSPGASMMGSLTGKIAPVAATMRALGPMSIGAEMFAQGGMGALEGIDTSKATDIEGLGKDALIGAGFGAATAPVGRAIGMGLGEIAEKGIEKLKNIPYAKQLAATVINKANITPEKAESVEELLNLPQQGPRTMESGLIGTEQGTLFGTPGKTVALRDKQLSEQLASQLEAPISKKNEEFTKAFKTASEQGKAVAKPDISAMQDLEEFANDIQAAKIKPREVMPTWTSENMQKYQQGELTPDIANRMLQEIKAIRAPQQGTLSQSRDNLIGSLTKNANQALDETTLQTLNKEKSAAWKAAEPFIQPGPKEAVSSGFQKVDASQLIPEERMARSKSFFDKAIRDTGKSTTQGDIENYVNKAENMLKQQSDIGNLDLNPEEMMQAVKNQSYLSAARQNVAGGSLSSEADKMGSINKIIGGITQSPYRLAEAASGSKALQNISAKLLSGTPESLTNIGRKLQQIPTSRHLGKGLEDAVNSGDKVKLNAAIFTILQNANARRQLEEEQD